MYQGIRAAKVTIRRGKESRDFMVIHPQHTKDSAYNHLPESISKMFAFDEHAVNIVKSHLRHESGISVKEDADFFDGCSFKIDEVDFHWNILEM